MDEQLAPTPAPAPATPVMALDPVDRDRIERERKYQESRAAVVVVRVVTILVLPVPVLGLYLAVRIYTDTFTCAPGQHCAGGGFGNLGAGIVLFLVLGFSTLLEGALALALLLWAMFRRQWIQATLLALLAAAAIVGLIGSTSDVAHRALVAVLGVGQSWIGYEVVTFAILLLSALVEVASTFLLLRPRPPAPA